eukprot:TRINITY_DN13548_c0_g3_i2.p1 TRINITY_DN13548_c0_g3~~TRINITY_DN13548_c0_g3_i2.p1  ORF type:complete len:399 (-),score=42.59 TRINITY_DN13548_c0_g3_i2:426-1580(-)
MYLNIAIKGTILKGSFKTKAIVPRNLRSYLYSNRFQPDRQRSTVKVVAEQSLGISVQQQLKTNLIAKKKAGMAGSVSMLAVLSVMWVSQWYGVVAQFIGGLVAASGIGIGGYKKKSLDFSGMIAASLVGLFSIGSSLRMGGILLAFYFSASKLTKIKQEKKQKIGAGYEEGDGRNWLQVFCNAGVPTVLAVLFGLLTGFKDVPFSNMLPSCDWWVTFLQASVLGYYACCCGDTWASEVGIFSKQDPWLVTTLKRVPRGTNGGISVLGLGMSAAGGAFIGFSYYLFGVLSPTLINSGLQSVAAKEWWLIVVGLFAGFFGSLIDSVLGATIQFTGYDSVREKIVTKPGPNVQHVSGYRVLDNNAVNIVAASTSSLISGVILCWILC